HAARRRLGAGDREPRPVLHGAPFDVRLPLLDQPVSALAGQVAVQAVEVPENDHLHGQLPLVLIGWPRQRSSSSRLASSWSISASCSSASASVLMAASLCPPGPPPLAVEAGTEAAPPSGTGLA